MYAGAFSISICSSTTRSEFDKVFSCLHFKNASLRQLNSSSKYIQCVLYDIILLKIYLVNYLYNITQNQFKELYAMLMHQFKYVKTILKMNHILLLYKKIK